MGEGTGVQNRMLRTAAAVAVAGIVAACEAGPLMPVLSNGNAPGATASRDPIAAPAPLAEREARHIVVQAGRSVSRIAAEYRVSQRAIIDANHLTPPYKIKTGQLLLIPSIPGPPPAPAAAGSRSPESSLVDGRASAEPTALLPAPGSSATALRTDAAATPTLRPAAAERSPSPEPSTAEQAHAGSALKPFEGAATVADKNPPVAAERLNAPVASGSTMTDSSPAPSGSAEPPAPGKANSTTQAAVPATAPPGVTCPPGTVGMWSEHDVTKIPVYICHQLHSQG